MSGTVRRVGVLAPMPSELAPVVKTMRLTRSAASECEGAGAGAIGRGGGADAGGAASYAQPGASGALR